MSKRFRKLSHSLYECKYHIVFCPKYRYRVLEGDVAETLRQEIYSLVKQKDGVEIIELNIQPDHVHIVLWIPPKYAISSLMGFLKGKLSTRMFQKYERLGKRYWGRKLWSRGYCVSTIGLDEDKIRRYVKWQEKKDKGNDQYQAGLFDN